MAGPLLFISMAVFLAGPVSAFSFDDIEIPLNDYEGDVIDSGDDVISPISKRDLEFNQYVPSYRLRGEPTCDELRAMWRLSKREARRATTTNELPRSRPYSYGRMIQFAHQAPSSRSSIFGSMHFWPSKQHYPATEGSFTKLRAMLGPGAGPPGSYSRVRDLLRQETSNSRGKYGELRKMRNKERQQEALQNPHEIKPVSQSLQIDDTIDPSLGDHRQSTVYYSGSRRLGTSSYPAGGFVGDLLPANNPRPAISTAWQPIPREHSLVSIK